MSELRGGSVCRCFECPQLSDKRGCSLHDEIRNRRAEKEVEDKTYSKLAIETAFRTHTDRIADLLQRVEKLEKEVKE